MAMFGIKGNKRMGQVTVRAEGRNDCMNDVEIGWINDNCQLCMSQCDIYHVQKKFGCLVTAQRFIKGK